MRVSTFVMIGFAALFGLLAVFVAQSWLRSQADARMKSLEAQQHAPAPTQTIVVASKPLRYGNELNASELREIPWSQDSLPSGAFAKINDVLAPGKRIVLAAIEVNEPILAVKITGPGQRATLSAVLHDGMKAVTIRVTDVEGVAGFVLPGDRVDIALTRLDGKGGATTDVVLQDATVLAIDQVADERVAAPAVAKSVTLEVDTLAAQKLDLAASLGTLSLLLRKAGETTSTKSMHVSLKDLFSDVVADVTPSRSTATITVKRGMTKEDYSVPVEGRDHPQPNPPAHSAAEDARERANAGEGKGGG
ncbi:MAG TPA: Flp pilus assembly protein CpaB [Xanthobacteraceae bacterium]|nr:Flp pilus assembly protein CpaB [Xanthobacteraceae bacterium]